MALFEPHEVLFPSAPCRLPGHSRPSPRWDGSGAPPHSTGSGPKDGTTRQGPQDLREIHHTQRENMGKSWKNWKIMRKSCNKNGKLMEKMGKS